MEGGQSKLIGAILCPYRFCNMHLQIFDADGINKYDIHGKCCQMGAWKCCRWPFHMCNPVHFDVIDNHRHQVLPHSL